MPQIPYPPLPLILSPLPVSSPPPASPTYPLGYRAAMIWLRAEAPSTSHSPPSHIILSHTRADTPPSGTPTSGTPPLLPIPLPASSPSLLLPSADHGADMPEVCLPPRKRLCFAFGPRAPATDDTELGRRMTEFTTRVRQDTDDIYMRLDDEQTKRQLMVGQLNMLYRDRRAHARTALLIERERLGCLERLGDDPWTLVILHVLYFLVIEENGTKRATRRTAAIAARDAGRNRIAMISHNSGMSVRQLVMMPLTVKGTDLTSYTQRFHELALLCRRMFPEESDKSEKYVGGLPDMIHGSVVAYKPKTMQDAVEIATKLMDNKIRTFAERQTESKRKFEDTLRHTHPPRVSLTSRIYFYIRTNKQTTTSEQKQNLARLLPVGLVKRALYGGSKPYAQNAHISHDWSLMCSQMPSRCNKIRAIWPRGLPGSTVNPNNANSLDGELGGVRSLLADIKCGVQGHFKRECLKL
ncbi:hypothetical protein Tco_0617646 [Tanacetum coccineum]|uniref:Reverse transcriptase domain-containing protein n=1 Tax=Tanacetum coccineum TaxID=301880 RepID=A0ABQ4WLG7_9ASTR